MQLLTSFATWGATGYYLIVPFLFVLTIVVLFHELGHLFVARQCGVTVHVFSIGFGRELCGLTDHYGTRWKIAAIPLGGYVKWADAASTPSRCVSARISEEGRRATSCQKPLIQRAAVFVGGPLANFLLAVVIFAGVAMFYGRQEIAPHVGEIVANGAAAAAGFEAGDRVISIDGSPIESLSEMQRVVSTPAGRTLTFGVERNGKPIELKAVPHLAEQNGVFGRARSIGVLGVKWSFAPGDVKIRKLAPIAAVEFGLQETWRILEGTLTYLGRWIAGHEPVNQIGGPVGIALASGEAARLGFDVLLRWAATISISVGLLNLFPIPLLDGGHLLFCCFEAVRGKPLSGSAQVVGLRIGFAIVLMLMMLATYNDVWRVIDLVRSNAPR